MTIAVVADIIGSRVLPDRTGAQRAIEEAVAKIDDGGPGALRPLTATVGDELQGEWEDLEHALLALLLLRLDLPIGIECRFGIGIGRTRDVPSRSGAIVDGPGWWAARAAIEHVHALEDRSAPRARTWIVVAPEEDDSVHALVPYANAYLALRDHLIGGMNERARRLVAGRIRGLTQKELAAREGISQSGVSQALAAAGAPALLAGLAGWEEGRS